MALPTTRYAGRFLVELDPAHAWGSTVGVISAEDGTAWLDYARLPLAGGGVENRVLSVEISDGADQPVRTLRATLQMVTDGGGSISSGAVDAPLNLLSGVYRPAIFGGRRVLVQRPLGDPASTDPDDWEPRFWGYVDEHPASSSGDLTIFARDAASRLMVPYLGPERWIGTEGESIPLGEAIQSVLDHAFGDGAWELRQIGELEWAVPGFVLARTQDVLQLVRDLAQQRGAVVRWWFDPGTERFQLTLFVLQVDKATPDFTFGPGETHEIGSHGSDVTNLRNDFRLRYLEGGTTLREIHRPATEGEVDSFGLRPLLVEQGATSTIDTEEEADAMLDSLETALRTPATIGSRQIPLTAGVEVNALLRFTADARVATETVDLYVTAWTQVERVSGESVERYTRVDLRGAPVGQIARWVQSIRRLGAGPAPPEADYQIHDVNLAVEAGATTAPLSWRLGAKLDFCWLGWAVVEQPLEPEHWDAVRDEVAPATSPVTLPLPVETPGGATELLLVQLVAGTFDPTTGDAVVRDVVRREYAPPPRPPALDEDGNIAPGAISLDEMIDAGVRAGIIMEAIVPRFASTVPFAATDHNTVTWDAGALRVTGVADAYAIAGGTTGDMTFPTFVYFDPEISTTALQTTTDIQDIVGQHTLLMCYCRPVADVNQRAMFVPSVGLLGLNSDALSANSVRAAQIAAGQVNATHISAISLSVLQAVVNQLSALTADLGVVNTGLVNNQASSPTRGIRLDSGTVKPGTWTDYLDLAALGTASVLRVGGLDVRADGSIVVTDPIEKRRRVLAAAFQPETHTTQFLCELGKLEAVGVGWSRFSAPVLLPEGALITDVTVRGRLLDVNNVLEAKLEEINAAGTAQTTLAHIQVLSAGATETTDTLLTPHAVQTGYTYGIDLQAYNDGTSDPGINWIDIVYIAPTYAATL